MKQLVLVIVCAAMLGGCYVGVRSPIYGGFEPPVVVPPPGVAVEPAVIIEPGWELYPWVYGAPYGYWGGGDFGDHYWKRGHYGHSEWRGPGRSYGHVHYGGHPGHDRGRG
jgi:hypothetical protein